MKVIIHNGKSYHVDFEKMKQYSQKAEKYFHGMSTLEIVDNHSEDSFSLFLDLCQSKPVSLQVENARKDLLALFDEWECAGIITELEDLILKENNHDLEVSFLEIGIKRFPRILSAITANYSNLIVDYPKLIDMKLNLIHGLYNASSQCTSDDMSNKLKSFKQSSQRIEEQIVSNDNRINEIKEKIHAIDEENAALQNKIDALEREIQAKQNENNLLTKESQKTIMNVSYLLQQLHVETSQIKYLQSEIECKARSSKLDD